MDLSTKGERFRYWFDSVMSRGLAALMALLALVSLAFIALISLIVFAFGLDPTPGGKSEKIGFWEALWSSLLRTLDPGTMGGDEGQGFRVAMLVVTIGGLILVASLISVISSAFNVRLEQLRKGRSRVLESEHTLILGWSPKVFQIVSELCIANESRSRAAIVILADRDKVQMEDELRVKVPLRLKTRVIVRSGNPMDLTDLEVASPHRARSIIILAPEESTDPDSVVIKTALALTNNPRRKAGKYHLVGELQDLRNLDAARLVAGDEADWIVTSELISRITVQTSRQSGLSVVYTELLDFGGDEFYVTQQPSLVGQDYFQAQLSFQNCCVVGMVVGGQVVFNPPCSTVYGDGDALILISEDDSVIAMSAPGTVDESVVRTVDPGKAAAERALILGYNPHLMTMLAELDEYVAPGSSVTVVARVAEPRFPSYDNLDVTFISSETTSRVVLESLGVQEFDHVIVLSYQGLLDPQCADAKTLITLLHLRDMSDLLGVHLNVVSEMLDDRNRELAEVTQADDFIVSDKLISLILSQISENNQLADVFATMLSSQGSEICLRPADEFVVPGAEVTFYTVLEAARRRGETAIGYRLGAHIKSNEHSYGVTINPDKSRILTFAPDDRVIVFAER